MNANDLLERAKFRRRLASLALRRVAAKHPLTPHELKEKLEKVSTLQSIYGAPKDENGKFVGKAGRTIALMKKWLDTKDKFGLPPVGEAFAAFVLREMDSANYIWGHEEASNDLSRDIRYNFGFDPEEVELVEENEKPKENTIPFQARIKKEEEKKVEEVANPMAANMASLPPMVQPLQGPLNMSASIKGFTAKAQYAYPVSKAEDSTVLPETPVVTRVDYTEDIEKAKAKSEFGKDPKWSANTRNVGKNDLLEDMSATQLKREAPSTTLDEEKQLEEYKKPDGLYPIRGFTAKPAIKSFVQKKN